MKFGSPLLIVGMLAALPLSACKHTPEPHEIEHPAKVEPIEGAGINRVTLTERAMERIAVKTDAVREQATARSTSPRKVVPTSALIYDPKGQTWVYTSPTPRTFVRHKVEVDYVENDLAVLNDGPPAGTVVVSMAAAEIYGADSGVGH